MSNSKLYLDYFKRFESSYTNQKYYVCYSDQDTDWVFVDFDSKIKSTYGAMWSVYIDKAMVFHSKNEATQFIETYLSPRECTIEEL